MSHVGHVPADCDYVMRVVVTGHKIWPISRSDFHTAHCTLWWKNM